MSSKQKQKRKNKQEKNRKYIPYLLAALSGALYILSIKLFNPIVGFLVFIPLIYALNNVSLKRTIGLSITFGGVFGILAFNWMLFAGALYSEHYIFGLLGTLLSTSIFIIFFTLLFVIFRLLTRNKMTIKNIFILAALVGVMEFGFSQLFVGYPLYYLRFGLPMLGSVYTIQLAEFGELYILSFFTVLVNGLIAYGLIKKRFPRWAVLVLILFLTTNFILYSWRTSSLQQSPTNKSSEISFNLINSNLHYPVDWKHDATTILKRMQMANIEAAKHPADFNVWTETFLPWSYEKITDHINKLVKQHEGSGNYTLIGVNTKYKENQSFNSAYLFNDKKEIVSRYDKRYLIKVLEAPVGNLIPVVSNEHGIQIAPGNHSEGMPTEKCYLGVFICNESSTSKAIRPLVLNGSDVLVNISNDSWFKDTYLINLHFYTNRMRAVTTRRDLVINSNGGVSGAITANGAIQLQELNDHLVIRKVNVQPHEGTTLFVKYPYLFAIVSALLILLFKLIDIKNIKRKVNKNKD